MRRRLSRSRSASAIGRQAHIDLGLQRHLMHREPEAREVLAQQAKGIPRLDDEHPRAVHRHHLHQAIAEQRALARAGRSQDERVGIGLAIAQGIEAEGLAAPVPEDEARDSRCRSSARRGAGATRYRARTRGASAAASAQAAARSSRGDSADKSRARAHPRRRRWAEALGSPRCALTRWVSRRKL